MSLVCSQMQKFMSMSRDDLVVKALSGSFDKWREWPYCVGSPDSIKDQGFMPRQARAVLALAGDHLPYLQSYLSKSQPLTDVPLHLVFSLTCSLPVFILCGQL